MQIGVLGTGDVGKVLGSGFAGLGHEVKIGSRDPSKVQDWVRKTGPKASAGTFAEAARFGEVIVLATLWAGTENAIKLADPKNFSDKVVIDATNPLLFLPDQPPKLAIGHLHSGGEQVQQWIPEARVVKCFNTVGNQHMVKPNFPGGPPDMFLCGNDDEAKETVAGLCKQLGWATVDLGGLEASRYLEPMAMVWILEYFRTRNGNHAFKLLRK